MDSSDASRVAIWAKQTIIFAIQLRSEQVGLPFSSIEAVRKFADQADEVLQRLSQAIMNETATPDAFSLRFAEQVFSWCLEHRFSG